MLRNWLSYPCPNYLDDRESIAIGIVRKQPLKKIAQLLGRHVTLIFIEIRKHRIFVYCLLGYEKRLGIFSNSRIYSPCVYVPEIQPYAAMFPLAPSLSISRDSISALISGSASSKDPFMLLTGFFKAKTYIS